MTTLRSAEYQRRVGSPEWKALKQRLIAARGPHCQRCRRVLPLDLHHLTYDRLGREHDADLELLCRGCHEVADQERASYTHYQARLNGWATKVYGEDWWERQDEEEVSAEFDEWCESKGY
jgi:5-methylcytosine-specific restriction endonuclease McrA